MKGKQNRRIVGQHGVCRKLPATETADVIYDAIVALAVQAWTVNRGQSTRWFKPQEAASRI